VVRADSLDRLTPAGWNALEAYGVRTVIDLRNDDERGGTVASRPASVTTVHLPHDAIEEREFWEAHPDWAAATPVYYAAHLERFPERSARVVAEIAQAPAGGVAFHCVDGRDRTGLIAVLLLAFAGVEASEITADYALSDERMGPAWAEQGFPDRANEAARFLNSHDTSAAKLLEALVDEVDLEARLRDGGLEDADLVALRERLVRP
jgi:protein-tyrosine phosphatase